MNKYYYKYKKSGRTKGRKILRIISLTLVIAGLTLVFYVFSPLILWEVYFSHALASYNVTSPIPERNIINSASIESLISQAKDSIAGVDYTNAKNWFPGFKLVKGKPRIAYYTISIPKLGIKDAVVSTVDNNLKEHLVNYNGTAIPPDKGNAVIFGHSTLPQLFNPKDYTTIFANAYTLRTGDNILVNISGVSYKYKIYRITVVDPSDISVLEQNYDNRQLTLITCTPPGTTWKRLVVKAVLEKI